MIWRNILALEPRGAVFCEQSLTRLIISEKMEMNADSKFVSKMIDGTTFEDCSMKRCRFDNVDLSICTFEDANLARAKFNDVNMSGVAITNANIDGLTIFGHDIRALIEAEVARRVK